VYEIGGKGQAVWEFPTVYNNRFQKYKNRKGPSVIEKIYHGILRPFRHFIKTYNFLLLNLNIIFFIFALQES